MKKEIWKVIKGYEGLYEISSWGRVKSIARNTTKGGIRKLHKSKGGYYSVILIKNGLHKGYRINRLVAEAFIPNPENKPFVNHINSIKTDNNVINLEWCTARENNTHHYKTQNTSSQYTGVSYFKSLNKWKAAISFNKKSYSLGYYENEIDAHYAYEKALKEINETGKLTPYHNPKNSSKYKGVTYYRKTNKWMSQIGHKGKTIYVGLFNTELEAFEARQKKLIELNMI